MQRFGTLPAYGPDCNIETASQSDLLHKLPQALPDARPDHLHFPDGTNTPRSCPFFPDTRQRTVPYLQRRVPQHLQPCHLPYRQAPGHVQRVHFRAQHPVLPAVRIRPGLKAAGFVRSHPPRKEMLYPESGLPQCDQRQSAFPIRQTRRNTHGHQSRSPCRLCRTPGG